MLQGHPVNLTDMLAAREERARQQLALRQAWNLPLLSFCLNIPGPVKTTPLLRRLFRDTLQRIQKILSEQGIAVRELRERHETTGYEALLALDGEAAKVKQIMLRVEETHPLGRLFDLDVLTADGQKLSRPQPRRCLLCGRQAQDCARSRRHTVEALTAQIESMLRRYYD